MTEANLSSVIEFDVDLSTVEAPKPLPAGMYDSTIQNVEPVISKNSNKKMAKVTYAISADQYPADYVDGNPNGTTLTQYLMLENDARSKYALKQFCQKIGAPLSNRIDLTTWIGLPARLEVINEMWEGQPQARISKVIG